MKVSYNWLQQAYFTESLPTPDEVAGVLGTRIFELEGTETVGGDTVLEFDVLPNRAHDCLSHLGIAREINVLFDRTDFCERDQIVEKYAKENVYNASDKKIACVIENGALVRRHVGRVIENIKVGESPAWLQDFLKSLGQRSINNVVDATNYVMLSLGQPNHVFDLDKFSGDTLFIRSAQEGEVITTLDKREVKLISGDLVLADSEGALDIAGIKGGTKAELGSTTTNILLSAANFDPAQIRKTARRTGVLTDASKRFENEPTPELCMPAIESLTTLILAIAGTPETRVGEIVDEYPNPVIPWTVAFTLLELNLLLGTELDNATVSEILQKFNCAYAEENNLFTVHIPVYRLDLKIKEDLIEEIGRVYGYEKIENKSTDSINYTPAINPLVALQDSIRGFLLEKDFSEVMTYSFVNTGEVQVLHPVAEDKSYLRTTIHQQLSESLEKNAYYAPLLGLDDIRIFEMGSVFTTAGEKIVLCLGYDPLIPKKRKQGTAEFLKNILSELETETGYELVQHIRYTGDLVIEVDLSLVLQSTSKIVEQYAHIGSTQISQARFTPISPFPFMTRDIAVWLPTDVAPTVLADLILTHAGALLVNAPRLVDQFEKEGRVSYSYRLVFQSYEKTLVDTEINAIMEEIYTACKQLGFETR